ncbi:MAG: polyprenyl synthetase family protein [Blastocatellia bacterium]|nr:polyprenyl synthetase family protein [Blastocatellia bacterium]
MSIHEYFKQNAGLVDEWLERLLPAETAVPTTIHQAMRYSVFAGGKRLRPILVIAAGGIFGAAERELLPAACSLEMIHTYSLIHDDLPAMDNDDLRRGRPTSHVVYGEAMAILAGDALLTQAFSALADFETENPARKVRVISEVAAAAGTVQALIGGQVLDIQSEGRPVTGAQLEEIHRAKTGAIIRCAVRIGAILGGADDKELAALTVYGEKAGLAFQVADDLLDETATTEELGKTAGKDLASHKATYTALYGVDGARQMADRLCREAVDAVRGFAERGRLLEEIARFIVERRS